MNNFDDLFEQQPQAEAAPQKQESQKERPKRQWWQVKEEKQRKEAYATLDKIFGEFSEGTGSMEAYLDVQSRFPFHSARNVLLIGEQCPDAVRVGGYKEWHSQGIEILEDEKRLPIIILEPGKAYRREDGSVGQNFYAKEVYDISQTILIDCQPSLGMLTVNALAAANRVIIPVQAEYLPAKGLEQLLQTVNKVKRQINPKLQIDGILLTMVDNRTNFAKEIAALLRETYGSKIKVFGTEIPHSVRAKEISAEGKSIFAHDPNGKVAEGYKNLTKEVIKLEKQREKSRTGSIR